MAAPWHEVRTSGAITSEHVVEGGWMALIDQGLVADVAHSYTSCIGED